MYGVSSAGRRKSIGRPTLVSVAGGIARISGLSYFVQLIAFVWACHSRQTVANSICATRQGHTVPSAPSTRFVRFGDPAPFNPITDLDSLFRDRLASMGTCHSASTALSAEMRRTRASIVS